MKKIALFITATAILALSAANAMAFGTSDEVKNAQKFYDLGRKDHAISLLVDYTNKVPDDADAYWALGEWYLADGRYSSAAEQYGYAVKLEPGKTDQAAQKFKALANNALKAGDFDKGADYARLADKFAPTFSEQIQVQSLAMSKGSTGEEQIKHLKTALAFSSTEDQKRSVGIFCLSVAPNSPNSDELYAIAEKAVGSAFVERFKPKHVEEVVYTATFDDAQADKEGRIRAIEYNEVQVKVGDRLVIEGIVPADAKEVYVGYNGKWNPVPRYGSTVISFDQKEYLPSGTTGVWIDKGKNVKVKVSLIRKSITKPNYNILAMQ